MRPIPKRLLIHRASAITETQDPDSAFESKVTETTVPLSYIRVEPSGALTVSKQNEQVRLSAVLIFDCKNSRPKGYDFSHEPRIEYNGQKYDIVGIGKFYDGRKLHHYEVELCL